MNFKRVGHSWRKEARYTVHDANGAGVGLSGNRREACRIALSHGHGHWVKDNINTYFYYGVTRRGVRRIRVHSVAHKAFERACERTD